MSISHSGYETLKEGNKMNLLGEQCLEKKIKHGDRVCKTMYKQIKSTKLSTVVHQHYLLLNTI